MVNDLSEIVSKAGVNLSSEGFVGGQREKIKLVSAFTLLNLVHSTN